MINKTIELTPSVLSGALTALAALIGSTAYVTWEIRKDYLDDLKRQVEVYEKSNSWKLPETLSSIKQASDQFLLSSKEKTELSELRANANAIASKLKSLTSELETAKEKLVATEQQLAQFTIPAAIVELSEGDSKFIVENHVNLALKMSMRSEAYVRLANRDRPISLGETVEYQAGAKNCKLTLLKTDDKKAKFQNACS